MGRGCGVLAHRGWERMIGWHNGLSYLPLLLGHHGRWESHTGQTGHLWDLVHRGQGACNSWRATGLRLGSSGCLGNAAFWDKLEKSRWEARAPAGWTCASLPEVCSGELLCQGGLPLQEPGPCQTFHCTGSRSSPHGSSSLLGQELDVTCPSFLHCYYLGARCGGGIAAG